MTELLKLTVHFGESDRVGGHLLSNVLLARLGAHRVRTAVLVRGAEGFGIRHKLHTQRLLTLSEDLPLQVAAVDSRDRIAAALPELRALVGGGLITIERARTVAGNARTADDLDLKLSVIVTRGARVEGAPAHVWTLATLRDAAVPAGLAVLGVDGLVGADRRRAHLLSGNARVPVVVTASGPAGAIVRAARRLTEGLPDASPVVERVRLCKRDGERLAEPWSGAELGPDGPAIWHRLTVHASERARHGHHPLHLELIRRLRLAGAAGATAVRGVWGYAGAQEPHGDRLRSIRRGAPVQVTLVDRPEPAARWWEIVDELTERHGVVTSERVPAVHAVGPGISRGGLRLPGA